MIRNTLACIFVIGFIGCQKNLRSYYVLDDEALVPEGIAYSSAASAYFLTSVAKSKIIRVDKATGKQNDFIASRQHNFLPGVGILVDESRGHLHALGAFGTVPDTLTSLFTFDLQTAQLLKRVDLRNQGLSHLLNDLIMAKDGTLYITDSFDSSVYRLSPQANTLELFLQSDEIDSPNGIAISEDNSKLYVASFSKGVRVIDIATRSILNKPDAEGFSQGIDGLEFYQGHLYAVQNGLEISQHNFRKLILNPKQDRITGVNVIDSNDRNKDLKVPLTFCIDGGQAVVIGNSNLEYLDQKTMRFPDPEVLRPTKLLLYDLSKSHE